MPIVSLAASVMTFSTAGPETIELDGGTGDDRFVFRPGFGRDQVTGFGEDGNDLVVFDRDVFASFAEVQAALSQNGEDAEIALDEDNVVVLEKVSVDDLNEDHFTYIG